MTENGSESLQFEPPEQENTRLREEKCTIAAPPGGSRHSCSATCARESASDQASRDGATGGQGGARQKENRAVSKPVSRERRCLRTAMGEGRQRVGICAGSREGLEGYQQKPSRGAEESRTEDT